MTGQKPIRILYIIDALNWAGGGESALLKMVLNLPKDRFECIVATFDARRPEWISNFPVRVVHLKLSRKKVFSIAYELWRLIRDERINIVHTFFPTSDLFGGLIARLSGSAVISSRRDMGILRSRATSFLYQFSNILYHQVHAVSEQVRTVTIERDKLSAHKVLTIPNGIDLHLFPLTEKRFNANPVILAVGNLRPVKGHDVLVRAAAIVCKEFPKARFQFAGQINHEEFGNEVVDLIRSLDLCDKIALTGLQHDVPAVLGAADLFCLPSRSEGMSNALLEAMAAGLPSVVTAVGGNPEVVENGKNGIVVPSENPEALAEGILKLLRDPALAAEMGKNARTTVERKFTTKTMADRIASSYESLMQGGSLNLGRRAGSFAA